MWKKTLMVLSSMASATPRQLADSCRKVAAFPECHYFSFFPSPLPNL
jgi:hypothetical protein